MSLAVLIAVCLAAPNDEISGPEHPAPPIPVVRRVSDITADVDGLLRREARAQSDSERAEAAYEMTKIYREIQRDPRFVVSEPLKESKVKLWNRLTRIKKEIKAAIKRRGEPDQTLTDVEVLALADSEIVSQSLAEHLVLSAAALGGPNSMLNANPAGTGARGGGMGPPDYGPELVDLIQRTIVPDFWDVNGGPGTVVYFRPLMCLVVRATSDVHHRLGGVVGGLRGVR